MAPEECRSHGQTCQATPQANGREAASERGLDVAKLGLGLGGVHDRASKGPSVYAVVDYESARQ